MSCERNREVSHSFYWYLCRKIAVTRNMGYFENLLSLFSEFMNKTSFAKSESHTVTVLFPWSWAINHSCMSPTNKNIFLLDRQEGWKGRQEECSIQEDNFIYFRFSAGCFYLASALRTRGLKTPRQCQARYTTVLWSQSRVLQAQESCWSIPFTVITAQTLYFQYVVRGVSKMASHKTVLRYFGYFYFFPSLLVNCYIQSFNGANKF